MPVAIFGLADIHEPHRLGQQCAGVLSLRQRWRLGRYGKLDILPNHQTAPASAGMALRIAA